MLRFVTFKLAEIHPVVGTVERSVIDYITEFIVRIPCQTPSLY
jgi:hypothetical protein